MGYFPAFWDDSPATCALEGVCLSLGNLARLPTAVPVVEESYASH